MEKTRVEFLFNFQMIDRLTFSDDVFEISFCQNQSSARYETLGIQVLNTYKNGFQYMVSGQAMRIIMMKKKLYKVNQKNKNVNKFMCHLIENQCGEMNIIQAPQ